MGDRAAERTVRSNPLEELAPPSSLPGLSSCALISDHERPSFRNFLSAVTPLGRVLIKASAEPWGVALPPKADVRLARSKSPLSAR